MSTANLLERVRGRTVILLLEEYSTRNSESWWSEKDLHELINHLKESVKSHKPAALYPLLDEWLRLEKLEGAPPAMDRLNIFLYSIYKVSRDELSAEQSQELVGDLLPIFFQISQYIHEKDVNRRIEEISQKRLSLEQLDKSKSDFISIAAHELKTPLTLMEGYSAMLRELIEQKKIFDEHIILLLDGMDSGSRRLNEIINDMIDVSLIDNEMLSLSFQPGWLYKILERVIVVYRQALQSRHLSFEVNRFNGDDILNFYDSERLFQAISNVVSNAIKYTPDGGKITIDGRRLHEFIEIVIIDNGIGIDAHDQEKIFDKFEPIGEVAYHSSGKLKFKGGGPGLGLPIAKGIIEAHGGRIWVESDGYDELNCPGSTFHILLPLREEPPDQPMTNLFEPLFVHKPNRDI